MCAHVHILLPGVQSHTNNVMYTGETVTDLCCRELESEAATMGTQTSTYTRSL